jgi:hypothetical protein
MSTQTHDRLEQATRAIDARHTGAILPEFRFPYSDSMIAESPDSMAVSILSHPTETINYDLMAAAAYRAVEDTGRDGPIFDVIEGLRLVSPDSPIDSTNLLLGMLYLKQFLDLRNIDLEMANRHAVEVGLHVGKLLRFVDFNFAYGTQDEEPPTSPEAFQAWQFKHRNLERRLVLDIHGNLTDTYLAISGRSRLSLSAGVVAAMGYFAKAYGKDTIGKVMLLDDGLMSTMPNMLAIDSGLDHDQAPQRLLRDIEAIGPLTQSEFVSQGRYSSDTVAELHRRFEYFLLTGSRSEESLVSRWQLEQSGAKLGRSYERVPDSLLQVMYPNGGPDLEQMGSPAPLELEPAEWVYYASEADLQASGQTEWIRRKLDGSDIVTELAVRYVPRARSRRRMIY